MDFFSSLVLRISLGIHLLSIEEISKAFGKIVQILVICIQKNSQKTFDTSPYWCVLSLLLSHLASPKQLQASTFLAREKQNIRAIGKIGIVLLQKQSVESQI